VFSTPVGSNSVPIIIDSVICLVVPGTAKLVPSFSFHTCHCMAVPSYGLLDKSGFLVPYRGKVTIYARVELLTAFSASFLGFS
jgi:hypothetical protein